MKSLPLRAMKKTIPLIIVFFIIQGCGTIRTLNPPSDHVEISYSGYKSHCTKIPRIYSGTFYDACIFYGEPNYEASENSTKGAFGLFMLDGLLSLSMDTVVLPYTVTRQLIDGSISVNRFSRD